MKKKIVSLVLVAALAFTALVGTTLAYFTDTDNAENVMTLGGVNIMQNEQQRGENGLEDFVQDKPLLPMVDNREAGAATVVDGFFNEGMANVVDKIVTVTNEAEKGAINKDAYVRTILAFETNVVYNADGSVYGDAHDVYIGVLGDFEYIKNGDEFVKITVDGIDYVLAVKVYENALAPAETTEPSLKQVFMAPTAGNEVATLFGDEYTILALSQGVQTAGFADAATALDTAFGDVATNAQAWFSAL